MTKEIITSPEEEELAYGLVPAYNHQFSPNLVSLEQEVLDISRELSCVPEEPSLLTDPYIKSKLLKKRALKSGLPRATEATKIDSYTSKKPQVRKVWVSTESEVFDWMRDHYPKKDSDEPISNFVSAWKDEALWEMHPYDSIEERKSLDFQPLLSDREVGEIVRRMEKGKSSAELLVSSTDLTEQHTIDLLRIKNEGEEARRIFVEANLALVKFVSKGFVAMGFDPEEVAQAGYIGLLHAVDGFDHKLGFKFSTYACVAIRRSIANELSSTVRAIRYPPELVNKLFNESIMIEQLRIKLGREPSICEIAESLQVEEDIIKKNGHLKEMRTISLDEPMENGRNRYENIPESSNGATEKQVESSELRELLVTFSQLLSPAQRRTFDLYFTDPDLSQVDIAKELNVSRQAVQQQLEKIQVLLKKYLTKNGFEDFL